MPRTVEWTDQGKADLRAIDQVIALRILHTLSRYLRTGEGDVERLHGIEPPEFRMRSGDYRVRFYHRGMSILVLTVKHRREAYR